MQAGITATEQLAAQTKLALRRLASAVAVVSCRDEQGRSLFTANLRAGDTVFISSEHLALEQK